MLQTRHVAVDDGDVVLLVGTAKGAFVLRSNASRTRWEMGGPYFRGHAIYALAYDGRSGRRRVWAGATSEHWGPGLSWSDDFGATWSKPETAPVRFPEDTGAAVSRIWQIRPGRDNESEALYCGVEPAALFVSRDAGESWQLVRGLWEHPHREKWQPGFGGLCLHTILPHPTDSQRMHVAISTGGVYRTDDGGAVWRTAHRGVRAQFLPDPHPEFGQCVHKIAMNPARPDRLYLQNHWGLYRSEDAGDSWQDIANGVPSDFGFPIVAHPYDPDVAYVVPLDSDEFRVSAEARLRVYRTRDAGGSWEALTNGLPQKGAMDTVLRDAMDADTMNPAGIYFGTTGGTVYGSPDGGATWSEVATDLPRILCVRAAVIGKPKRVPPPKGSAARKETAAKAARAKAAPKKKAPAKKKAVPKRPAAKKDTPRKPAPKWGTWRK